MSGRVKRLSRQLFLRLPWSVRLLWRQMKCKHTHTFEMYTSQHDMISPNMSRTRVYGWWYSSGTRRDTSEHVSIRGCYLCGLVWCCDLAGSNGPCKWPTDELSKKEIMVKRIMES